MSDPKKSKAKVMKIAATFPGKNSFLRLRSLRISYTLETLVLLNMFRLIHWLMTCVYVGVESVAIKGDDKDKIEVIGNEIDTVQLAKALRKKVGVADLISVGPAKDEKKDEKKIFPFVQYPYNYYYGAQVPGYQPVYEVRDNYNDPNCSIM